MIFSSLPGDRPMNTRGLVKLFLPALAAILLPLPDLAGQPLVTVRSGHGAPVTAIKVQSPANRLFSVGQDGNLKVWEPTTEKLLQTIRADRLPIRSISLFPDGNRVAIYATDGRRNHRISVWDWVSGERLFLHTPEEEVLSMEVSPQGSYIIYSVPDLRSLRILDAGTGRQLPFLRQSTGIISWFVTAAGEERVMTYAPSSGAIVYRNIVTGTSAGTFQAPPDLDLFTLLDQRRYAAVRTASGLLGVLDLLNGSIVSEVLAGEIESIQKDPGGPDILVFSRSIVGGRTVRRYRFQDGRLTQRFETRRAVPEEITHVTVMGRELFGGDSRGRLLRWAAFESEPIEFARNITEPVRDLFFTGDRLFLLAAEELISVSSDFFGQIQRTDREVSYVDQRVLTVQAGAGARFLATGGSEILLWTPEHRETPLRRFNQFSGATSPLPITIPPGIVSLTAHGDEVLLLTRAGLMQLVNYNTGTEVMTYRGSGFQTAIRTDREVFLGKAYEGGVLDSAILRIDPDTGQTVPMETEARLVFALSYDHQRGRLFAIGVVADRSGNLNTVIEVFDGPNYGRRRTILEIPGEHLDVQVVVDPARGTAYTTLDDRGGILRWDGARITELSRNQAHIPRRLVLSGNYVFAVNWDGTVSLIDRFSGDAVIDIVVIDSPRRGDWVALRPDGRFFVSRSVLAGESIFSLNSDTHTLQELVFESAAAPIIPQRPPGGVPSRSPADRFDTGRSRIPEVEHETEQFDPDSGSPAPSS
ncbi:MAG: hypothetical protein EA427_13140 [Spirochaetaceae bacterium]|nr:MAG: hypothetical protein EA427_13140 [Spirochaetaceae bacterium]